MMAASLGVLLLIGIVGGMLVPRASAWRQDACLVAAVLLAGVAWWAMTPVMSKAAHDVGWGCVGLACARGQFTRHPPGFVRFVAGMCFAISGALGIAGAMTGRDYSFWPAPPLASPVSTALPGHWM